MVANRSDASKPEVTSYTRVVRVMNIDGQTLDQLQDEVFALLSAWVDRGITPHESAQVLAGMGHMILSQTGTTFSELVAVLEESWRKYNGKF